MPNLTENQRSVLSALVARRGVKDEQGVSLPGLTSPEFADMATVQHGRREWANPILKSLEAKGCVERDGKVAGAQKWKATHAGVKALLGIDAENSEAQRLEMAMNALAWFIENDDTNSRDEWESENAYWLAGRRAAVPMFESYAEIQDRAKKHETAMGALPPKEDGTWWPEAADYYGLPDGDDAPLKAVVR